MILLSARHLPVTQHHLWTAQVRSSGGKTPSAGTRGPRARQCPVQEMRVSMTWMHETGWGRMFQRSRSGPSCTAQCTQPLKQRPGGVSLQRGVFSAVGCSNLHQSTSPSVTSYVHKTTNESVSLQLGRYTQYYSLPGRETAPFLDHHL